MNGREEARACLLEVDGQRLSHQYAVPTPARMTSTHLKNQGSAIRLIAMPGNDGLFCFSKKLISDGTKLKLPTILPHCRFDCEAAGLASNSMRDWTTNVFKLTAGASYVWCRETVNRSLVFYGYFSLFSEITDRYRESSLSRRYLAAAIGDPNQRRKLSHLANTLCKISRCLQPESLMARFRNTY
ncbi:MAG: hypothetical protein ABI977_35480 [Acidobacteriota bacterium]